MNAFLVFILLILSWETESYKHFGVVDLRNLIPPSRRDTCLASSFAPSEFEFMKSYDSDVRHSHAGKVVIIKDVESKLGTMSVADIFDSIHFLDHIKVDKKIPPFHSFMVAAIDRVSTSLGNGTDDNLRDGQVAIALVSIVQARLKWRQLPTPFKNFIISRAFKQSQPYLVQVIWSFGKLSLDYHFLPSSMKTALSKTLESLTLTPTMEIHKLLYGIALMNMNWSRDLSARSRQLLHGAIQTNVGNMDEREVADVINALGRLQAAWRTLPPAVTRSLLIRWEQVVPSMTSQSLVNSIW